MGVGKVAADAIRDDIYIGDAYSDIDAGDDTDNNAGCRLAKKRPYSPKTLAPTAARRRRQG